MINLSEYLKLFLGMSFPLMMAMTLLTAFGKITADPITCTSYPFVLFHH